MACSRRVISLHSQWTTLSSGTTLAAVASIRLSRTSITFKLPLRTINETTEHRPLSTETLKEYGDRSVPQSTGGIHVAGSGSTNRHINQDATNHNLIGDDHAYSQGGSPILRITRLGLDLRQHSQGTTPSIF